MKTMSETDFVWLYNALTEALSEMPRPRIRQAIFEKAFDGEIYTRIRAKVFSSCLAADNPVRAMFATRKKYGSWNIQQLRQCDKERMATMFNTIKKNRLDADQETSISELETLVSGMQANTERMFHITRKSQKLLKAIEELDEFLANP